MRKARPMHSTKNKKTFISGVLTLLVILCAAFLVPGDRWQELAGNVGVSLSNGTTAAEPDHSEGNDALVSPIGNEGFYIYFIDVGQADAAVICCDGYYMLIDGGNVPDGQLVREKLSELGAEKLLYVIGTHAHEDHMGGLSYVCGSIPVGSVYTPLEGSDEKFYGEFEKTLTSIGKEALHPSEWDAIALGSARCVFLSPTEDEFSDINDTSLIIRITYKETSFLFMGDASTSLEKSVIESGADVEADLIKIGHHGSASSTSYRLLYESMPRYAVISVGEGNRYGHPDEDTLSILRDADAAVYRTDECGDIIVTSDGKEISITSSKR